MDTVAAEKLKQQLTQDLVAYGLSIVMVTPDESIRLDPRLVIIQPHFRDGYENLVAQIQAAQLGAASGALDTPSTMHLPSDPRKLDGVEKQAHSPEPLMDSCQTETGIPTLAPDGAAGDMPIGVPSSRAHAFAEDGCPSCKGAGIRPNPSSSDLARTRLCPQCGGAGQILKSNEDLQP